jgi:hypothetical protein
MKYAILVGILFLMASQTWARQEFTKKKGFFGFTRGCIADWENGDDRSGGCVTSFIPLALGDTITAPFQTVMTLMDATENISNAGSSTDKKSSAESSNKASSESNSSKKDKVQDELPEERKVKEKLSLFMTIADDARDYLATGEWTTLLLSAAFAIRSDDHVNGDLTVESHKILNLEAKLLEVMNRE